MCSRRRAYSISGYSVSTVSEIGWRSSKTAPSSALPIRVTSNTIAAYLLSFDRLQRAIETVRQGDVIRVDARPGR
jgi:hypothetical protein